MSNSIYLATTQPYSGKSLVSLGITELLLRRTSRVGVFRPVIEPQPENERDKNLDVLLTYFNLPVEYEETYVFTRPEASTLLAQNRTDDFLDKVIEKYKVLEEKCDFILCIGSDFEGGASAPEFDFNAQVARNLGAPVLIVTSAANQSTADVINAVKVSQDAFVERGCQVLGSIVNRTDPEKMEELTAAIEEQMPPNHVLYAIIPEDRRLSSPTLAEVAEHLDAEVLYGSGKLDTLARHFLVIAMEIPNYLRHLKNGALLITPGDRSDVVVSALQAHRSRNYPQIAGMVLTGGLKPEESVAQLIEGLNYLVPILSVETDTFQTAARITSVRSYITADSPSKIAISLRLFERHANTEALIGKISSVEPRGMTPKMFLYNLVRQARQDRQHIVLPEGNDERILRATEDLLKRNIVDITLIGDPNEVRGLISRLNLDIDLSRVQIVTPAQSPHYEDYARTLMELRQHKGMTMDMAHDLMCDVSYFGTMMVYKGHADGMVSGAAHTTQHTILPALQFVKTKPGFSVVSSVFFMLLDDRVLVYGDCAVNPDPNPEQLAEIAISSADTAEAFGIQPRVAMLSYSSGESGVGADVEKVREATQIARQRRPDLKLDGPIQYDAAVAADVAAKKMPRSEVAGQATVFIFPDLNTGNNTYKAVQRETGAIAVGPILQGLKKPVNDLSRGATVDDVINTVVITAIQAQNT